jgi:hypothetical protein
VLDEAEALRLVEEAVDRVGGAHRVVASPRHPFALQATRDEEVDGHTVEIHYSEISAPAIASVEGWVFEVRVDEFVVLSRPRVRKP